MYDKDTLTVHRNESTVTGWYYADVTAGFAKLYTTPLMDRESLAGWVKDLQHEITNARCLWCADNDVNFVTEIVDGDGLEILGFCSHACHTEALREAHAER